MKVQENISLKPYNSFGIDVAASHFLEIDSVESLQQILKEDGFPPPFVLSGGSNLLLTGPLEALVLFINIRGKKVVKQNNREVVIRAMAGENWHELVLWTLEKGFGGLENLALIPGKAGTAPIQNIGAYGVELKDVFVACEAVEIASGNLRRFEEEDCKFSYRDSLFKGPEKGNYIIVSLELRLTRKEHEVSTSYGDIENELQDIGISDPTPMDIARAVIAIRQRKLPDPANLGNSGSFFKNPVIPHDQYQKLKQAIPEIPGYAQNGGGFKVPAGWLIEKCGFKGFRSGDAGVHDKQALVLVNYGNASGKEILDLAINIQQAVFDKYGIELQAEVNII